MHNLCYSIIMYLIITYLQDCSLYFFITVWRWSFSDEMRSLFFSFLLQWRGISRHEDPGVPKVCGGDILSGDQRGFWRVGQPASWFCLSGVEHKRWDCPHKLLQVSMPHTPIFWLLVLVSHIIQQQTLLSLFCHLWEAHQPVVLCFCCFSSSTWTPKGDYIASNTDECSAILSYAVNLKKHGTVSFDYFYPDNSIYFEFFVSVILWLSLADVIFF